MIILKMVCIVLQVFDCPDLLFRLCLTWDNLKITLHLGHAGIFLLAYLFLQTCLAVSILRNFGLKQNIRFL